MRWSELAEWQWLDYGQYHQTRRNLLLHVVAVPAFLFGNVVVLAGIFAWTWWMSLAGVVISAVSFGVQGLGHKGEPVPPVPFKGPANLLARMVTEQWVTFPRFLLSGQWGENLRRSSRPPGSPA